MIEIKENNHRVISNVMSIGDILDVANIIEIKK
jgi:hypothetical protein